MGVKNNFLTYPLKITKSFTIGEPGLTLFFTNKNMTSYNEKAVHKCF